jgi:valyl-tRNA synthetase
VDKAYDPKQVEHRWYQTWADRGYFHASVTGPGSPYVIVIPPPNITGSLHMGHALNNTLQDILIRWRRMQGRNTLWVPGTDHAGIATQNVVEKQLLAEGTTRDKLGRDRFIQKVWEWKAQSGGAIIEQLKRLGSSCDWDRLRFTMDEGLSKAVREVFVRLYEDGLIYRGERLINWCPRCLTALSDIEVEHADTTGKLYHIRYPLADDPTTHLTVATTRPETMLGDTGVAVHPEDPRYNRFIGKRVKLPLTRRLIPVVGDSILVDREFGTGAVKITPAHDFNDFEAGLRHNLPRLALFDQQARLDPAGLRDAQVDEALQERLASKPVHEARVLVVEALEKSGFLARVEDHAMALGKCYRCKTAVEPYLSPQWFVKIQPLAEPAIKAVESGQIRLIPEQWTNNYLGWMRDIRDWCISRQIWWGHQIPAWYCVNCGRDTGTLLKTSRTFTLTAEAKPLVARHAPSHCPDCGHHQLVRDPDVLDTWFSSALWPFSTLGWPDNTPELKTFYPTSTLVTGFDILFFWVARMIMMGLKFMEKVPFKDVYIHALVRDAEGQKMSKSKGNVINPLEVMDQYGTDALRFTLAAMASPGRDIKLSEERIEGYRNFANKLWNAARFILMNLDGPLEAIASNNRSFADRWILSRLNRTIREVTAALEQYRFDQASNLLYQFVWHEYCDWYLEMIKPALQNKDSIEAKRTRQTLVESFEITMRLLHPFMPFISEEIWQALPHVGESLVIKEYPHPQNAWDGGNVESFFLPLEQLVTTVRTWRALLNYPPGKKVSIYIPHFVTMPNDLRNIIQQYFQHLARSSVTFTSTKDQWPRNILELVTEGKVSRELNALPNEIARSIIESIPLGMMIEDIDLRKALERIRKQKEDSAKERGRVEAKLANAEFKSKAPMEVILEHEDRHQILQSYIKNLTNSEQQLQEMMK